MRATLDTVGRLTWPRDRQGRPLTGGFEELAEARRRSTRPAATALSSVGMLTEGWDCSTVTHILGLRPFMSQLLCEQVVGRGLRRSSYQTDANDRLEEEVAKVFGVPFEVVPFKATTGPKPATPPQHHVHALPERARYEIRFPRVEGYRQEIATGRDRPRGGGALVSTGRSPEVGEAPRAIAGASLAGPGRLSGSI
jgi:type III restriction enzyme